MARRLSASASWRYGAVVVALSCGPREPPSFVAHEHQPRRGPTSEAPAKAEKPPPEAPRPQGAPLVAVSDPATLAELELSGFRLGEIVVGANAQTTSELARVQAFKSMFDVIRADVRAAARPYPLARVTSIDGFRLFEERWLDSNEMSFELSGVFNRLDRRPFHDRTCGEVRLLYRLRYETEQGGTPMASRLPMTLNVVFRVGAEADAHCRAAAEAWYAPPGLGDRALARWLADGPLGPAMRERWTLKSVELNLQTIRLQSSVHPTLAGHIEYALRVFQPSDGSRQRFVPGPMENMPDVAALKRDKARRARLLAYLREPATLRALDLGIMTIPAEFLATGAMSVSPRGLSRLKNRPFRELFSDQDFAGVDFGAYRTLGSPAALLRRLDGTSCVGCHQSRSIAGFHHVGEDSEATPRFNALFSGMSAHLADDLERRRAYVAALAEGREPDEYRPIAERQGVSHGYGAPCGLGDPGFSDWSCADGLSCVQLEDTEVGACLAEGAIGAPCEYGVMHAKPKPQHDHVGRMSAHACGAAQSCSGNFSGFPLGSCGAPCSAASDAGACGDFLDVDGFQNCLRGRIAHDECAERFVFRTGLRACDAQNPCRQDYVCARTATPGAGACIPPYFIYQLRLDGYPLRR